MWFSLNSQEQYHINVNGLVQVVLELKQVFQENYRNAGMIYSEFPLFHRIQIPVFFPGQ